VRFLVLALLATFAGIARAWREVTIFFVGAGLTAVVVALIVLARHSSRAGLTLTDAGAVLPSVRRRTFIPWSELRSVERIDKEPSFVEWRRTDGSVTVMADAVDLDRVFAEIGRRAPHVRCRA